MIEFNSHDILALIMGAAILFMFMHMRELGLFFMTM